jgi:DNA polymerase
MGAMSGPPDRATLLASIRDYVEQLREEGLEGLPGTASTVSATSQPLAPAESVSERAAPVPTKAVVVEATPTIPKRPAPEAAPPAASTELFYLYPGLEQTADLKALREFIGDCQRCKLAPCRTNLVFGVGDPHAELMFVGEAPGADEDTRGEPFVGRAGQLLTDIIERGMGLTRAQVYICNVIKCRPPENRNPEPDEVAACEPFLFRQIDLVRPKAIVALGSFAVQALLKVKTPISKLRGNWQTVRGVRMMPTFHPAYLLRNPADKRLVWADIQQVMAELGMETSKRGARP